MGHIVTLTTDFGLADGYVAAMKAVILSIAPRAELVDITHEIAPQDVWQGALALDDAARYFGAGTVHVAVVDPGVGTSRRAIAIRTPDAVFIAPDNGILSLALGRYASRRRARVAGRAAPTWTGPRPARSSPLPDACVGIDIDGHRVGLPRVSSTFHGRDIFAPAAAYMALGMPLSRLGSPLARIALFSVPRPVRGPDGALSGHVIQVDRFGNLITDVEAADLPDAPRVEVAGHSVPRLSRTYADGEGLVVLIGSSGRLEIAWRNDSAARRLGLGPGAEVRVVRQP